MSQFRDPYKTQKLVELTQQLARPVRLPTYALIAVSLVPTLIVAALLVGLSLLRPAPSPVVMLATPTLGLSRSVGVMAAQAPGLPRALVAYAAPDGPVIGALEPGRPYRLVARSGLAWAQLDVAAPGEPVNLVWVRAEELPELRALAVADLATPQPTAAPQVRYVVAPAAPAPAAPAPPSDLAPLPEQPPVYLISPATPRPRSVVVAPYPTTAPCRIGELGAAFRVCNGVTP